MVEGRAGVLLWASEGDVLGVCYFCYQRDHVVLVLVLVVAVAVVVCGL